MDVRCQKCGIEYEFDDAKVTIAGVTVKCTSCGHVFKVKKDEPSFGPGAAMMDLPRAATATTLPPVSPQTDGAEWMVRQPSGTVFRFKELTTLQKWIVERKVARDDEISKTGKSWKRLGDIAELASFFQVVDAANAALQVSVVPVQPAMSVPQTGAGFVVMHQHQTGGTQVGMQAAAVSPPQPAPDPQPAPPLAPSVPVAAPAGDKQARGDRADKARATQDVMDDLDEDDPVLAWGKARRRRNAAILFVVALLVAVGVLIVVKPPFVVALLGVEDTTGLDVDGVARAVRADDAAAISSALAGVRAAQPTTLQSALEARLLCAQAAHAREEERLHGLLRALVPADAAQHDAGAEQANQRAGASLARAYTLVNTLRAQAPKLAEAHIAAAAYNLEKGGLAELKADLESARGVAQPDQRGQLDAEIGVLQALADVRAVVEKPDATTLQTAADRVPASADVRLRYAKASLSVTALARGFVPGGPAVDRSSVQKLVDELPMKDARHALLVAALQAMQAPVALADAGVAAVDAGVADAGPAAADAGAGAGVAADSGPETYESLMQRAERANLNERAGQARDLYLRALKLRPTSARAHLGLGWAALDLEKNAEAQRAFRKVIALDGDNGEAHFGLAEALRFGGNKAGALEEYKLYVKMDPNGRDAAVARRAIESLQ